MRLFVTAGNTWVPIDRVRCITNIFTGRTGAAIALEAQRRGHHVTLATSNPETVADAKVDPARWQIHTYRTFDDLAALMEFHIDQTPQDAVVHCAAVSDYLAAGVFAPSPEASFEPGANLWHGARHMVDRAAGKVKSEDSELWLRLVRAPKLVDRIRGPWRFAGTLVKFKLEVGLSEAELQSVAERSRQHSAADWMVANTLEGSADWALIGNALGYRKIARAELSLAVCDLLDCKDRHHG